MSRANQIKARMKHYRAVMLDNAATPNEKDIATRNLLKDMAKLEALETEAAEPLEASTDEGPRPPSKTKEHAGMLLNAIMGKLGVSSGVAGAVAGGTLGAMLSGGSQENLAGRMVGDLLTALALRVRVKEARGRLTITITCPETARQQLIDNPGILGSLVATELTT